MPSGGESIALPGAAMVPLVHAVAQLGAAGLDRYAVVGGVAVTARLGQAHRATVDVDTVVDETRTPDAVEALLGLPDAERDPSGEHRVRVGGTKIEILGVGPIDDDDLVGIPTNDALFVAAHVWALDTATPLTLIATDDPAARATAPFATPAALVAMKLHAIEDRSASGLDKRAGDAWDIYRLLVDRDADGDIRDALASAPARLRELVRDSVMRVLVTNVVRTRGWMQAGDAAVAAVTAAELRFVGQRLVEVLR